MADKQGETLNVVLRNPASTTDFPLNVDITLTVGQLQRLISEKYPGNPPIDQQTLIYAGKVLKVTTVTLRELTEKVESLTGSHTFHLVVKHNQSNSTSSSSTAPTSSPAVESVGSSVTAAEPARNITNESSPSGAPNVSSAAVNTPAAPAPASTSVASTAEQATNASAASVSAQAPEMPDAQAGTGASSSGTMPTSMMSPSYPYMYYNPVVVAAYQAAYAAALAAGSSMQQSMQQGSTAGQPMMRYTAMPMALYYPAFGQSYMPSTSSGQPNGIPYSPMAAAMQFGYSPLMLPPGMMAPAIPAAALAAHVERVAGVSLSGLRQRHGQQQQPQEAAGQQGAVGQGQQQHRHHHNERRHRRQRVFTIRISTRLLLQLLVFATVLYKHFTMQRFLVLSAASLVVYLFSVFAPLRRLMHGMQPQQRQQPGAQAPARPSFLMEIGLVIVGFITSLMPSFNHNPDDAAAFAAAQDLVAREAQQEGQGQGAPAPMAAPPADNAEPQQERQDENNGGNNGGEQQPAAGAGAAAGGAPAAAGAEGAAAAAAAVAEVAA